MFQKLCNRRLFCVGFVALISGAAIVDCASAQHANTYTSDADRGSSIAVAPDQPGADGDRGLLPSRMPPAFQAPGVQGPQVPLDGRAASSSFSALRPAGRGDRTSLEMIAPQAQAHNDYALKLAECGAVQSAQAEFIIALNLVADALDADSKDATRAHARAVHAGLTAIEDAKDFVPADTPHDIEINLAQLASTHRTPVLRNVDTTRMTRAEALQRYHSYATQQLAFAGGRSTIASAALYGLGRAEFVTIPGASTRNRLGAPNAMALYQAALLVDPQNHMASNELGVLMARYGDLEGAAGQLLHSVSLKPQVETWHNLATVYRRMGQPELAERAEQERGKLLAEERGRDAVAEDSTDFGTRSPLKWVDEDTFAAAGSAYGFDGPAVNANKSASIPERDSLGKRLASKLMPWPKAGKAAQDSGANQLSQKSDPSRNGESSGWTLFK